MDQKTNKSYLVPFIIGVSFAVGLLVGAYVFKVVSLKGASAKIDTIMKYISSQYVEPVDIDSLLESSIPDIIAKLDPHSVYLSADELTSANEELEGSFSGIGIQFNMLTDTVTVLEVISGGPSEKVGLQAGDRIITINDTVAAGVKWDTNKIMSRLRGPKGTKVKLGIQRNSAKDLLTYEVTRGDIPVTSIDAAYMIEPKVGYIKVNKFIRTTYNEFLDALNRLSKQGAKDFVIDLRGNGGGFMEMAILMANEFLDLKQPIVSTHGQTSDSESHVVSDGNGSFKNAGVTVLLDEFSASASEIFAGAMQDNDRGLVVGRRSFGKGLVQQQFALPGNSAVRLTTARYYTPSGRCIQKTYTGGANNAYNMEIIERFNHGEAYNADSIKLDTTQKFFTMGNRPVYGGGGIMPDVFVPTDTTGISSYYINVTNAGLLHKFAFNFVDANRSTYSKAKTTDQLLKMLPDDNTLLHKFVDFADRQGGIAPKWFYINLSRNLIVNQLKGLIARDIIGQSGYYEVTNTDDTTVARALKEIKAGNTKVPITIGAKP